MWAFVGVLLNNLNAEWNPICHLLALIEAHLILYVSRIRFKYTTKYTCLWKWNRLSVPKRRHIYWKVVPPAYEDGTDRVFRNFCTYISDAYWNGTNIVFRNVGIYNSDAGEPPKRKHTVFRTRRNYNQENFLYNISSISSLRKVLIAKKGYVLCNCITICSNIHYGRPY